MLLSPRLVLTLQSIFLKFYKKTDIVQQRLNRFAIYYAAEMLGNEPRSESRQ